MKIDFKNSSSRKILWWVLAFVILGGGYAGTYYFYSKYESTKETPEMVAEKETKSLVNEIKKLTPLPEDETPVLATVSDKTKLSDKPFFKDAENGDKLLVYNKAMKAVLYRPSTKQIIAVAPLSMTNTENKEPENTNENAGEQVKKESVSVVFLNGTETAGLASQTETKLRESFNSFTTVKKENAAKTAYEGILVVNLSGNDEIANHMALILKGKVTRQLPEGEVKQNADIVIIVGK
jgi:hypothetical protein